MKIYLIEFTYTTKTTTDKSIEIKAKNEKEAIKKLQAEWSNGEISIEAIMSQEKIDKAIMREE